MQCANNQKQIVLAMHNYHDTQQSFPWGARSSVYGTWAIQVLPFLEKNQITTEYNWNDTWSGGTNRTLLNDLVIPTYTCPSDGNNNKTSNPFGREHNYVACMGREGVLRLTNIFNPTYNTNVQNCLIDGIVYGRESRYRAMFTACCNIIPPTGTTALIPAYPFTTRFEDIIDGTSNTIALSETIQGVSPDGSTNDLRGLIWWGFFCFFNTNQAPNTMVADISLSTSSAHVRHRIDLFNTTVGDADGDYLRLSARSWHIGGVNAGLADGSVRFVQDQIDLNIWRAAGSTNGGEIESLH
jgi:hypothetical protein